MSLKVSRNKDNNEVHKTSLKILLDDKSVLPGLVNVKNRFFLT